MNSTSPFVSVICLCFNHKLYVEAALASVFNQSYRNYEIIVVDDASTDGSADVIENIVKRNPSIRFIRNDRNVGNCKAFNLALTHIRGEFIIDLAADDELLPDRILRGVTAFMSTHKDAAVQFTDAEYIDATGKHLYFHSDRFPHDKMPQGDVYKELIERFFICSPTMMFRKEVMDYLEGYDETLSYEDFDFWIRSSRVFKYCYLPDVLVKKRILPNSLSKKQFVRGSRHQYATYKVCEKIFHLNQNKGEHQALKNRLLYEAKWALKLRNFMLAARFMRLWLRRV